MILCIFVSNKPTLHSSTPPLFHPSTLPPVHSSTLPSLHPSETENREAWLSDAWYSTPSLRLCLGVGCHRTLTPAKTARQGCISTLLCAAWLCRGTVFLPSAPLSSLGNSMHPPKREINPPKIARGCAYGGVIKQDHMLSPVSIYTSKY